MTSSQTSNKPSLNSKMNALIRFLLAQHRRWMTVGAVMLLFAGCAAGPSLRALNPNEAKIDVYPTGEIRVFGEPIALDELSTIVANSSTEPSDTVLIRLHDDPDSPAMQQMRSIVTDQMIRANHYKYRFFSTPRASVTTYDRHTKKAETFVSEQPVEALSGAELEAEVKKIEAEREAYQDGTYVSEAAGRKPVATGDKPEELSVKPTYVGGSRPKQRTQQPKTPAVSTPQRQSSQEALRDAYRRQQQQRTTR